MHHTGNSIKLLTGELGCSPFRQTDNILLLTPLISGNSHPRLAEAVAARFVVLTAAIPYHHFKPVLSSGSRMFLSHSVVADDYLSSSHSALDIAPDHSCCSMMFRLAVQRLGIQLTACHVSKFLSLETSVQIHSSVRDEDVFILQSPSPPAINDHLMELLIMISGTPPFLTASSLLISPFLSLQDRFGKASYRGHPLLPVRSAG